MGLDKKPFMPLSKALRRSSSNALAVMARIGIFASAGSSSARICRVAVHLNGLGVLLLLYLFCGFVPQPVSRKTAITNAASREIRRCNVLLFTKSFSSQRLGSCHFPAKLLWLTCRTSLPARVYAVKPTHGKDAANILRVSCFVLSLYRERAENDRNIKIFYCCHEGL